MTRDGDRWQHGHEAWERLARWRSGHVGDDRDTIGALGDIVELRQLLDQAELAAVRAARRAGKSWTEIATRLGITRQSAWERWKDLDDEAAPVGSAMADAADGLVLRASRLGRGGSMVKVPNVIGLTWEGADLLLRRSGLVGSPTSVLLNPGLVTDQSPEAGAKVPPGSTVALWLGRGGGTAGVREPRRPSPSPLEAQARPDVA